MIFKSFISSKTQYKFDTYLELQYELLISARFHDNFPA